MLGDVGSYLVFPWGEGPKPLRDRGERAGGRSSRWGEPSPAVSSAPRCVWSSGVTGGICSLPFCLAQATPGVGKDRLGLHRSFALRCGELVCPSSGTAWLCLPGAISAAGTGEVGQGDATKRWQRCEGSQSSGAEQGVTARDARRAHSPRGMLFAWLFALLTGFQFHSEEVTGWSIPGHHP